MFFLRLTVIKTVTPNMEMKKYAKLGENKNLSMSSHQE